MKLDKLFAEIISGPVPGLEVTGLAFDSRQVKPGQVFFAMKGPACDGHDYISAALARGAAAVVAEQALTIAAPCFIVPKARETLGRVADRWYGEPSAALNVIGITGTNGKTTTSFLLHGILAAVGRRPSLLGTVQNAIAGQVQSARQTTPDILSLQSALAKTRAAGGRDLVVEVSSHALDQSRVAGVRFAVGVFTNLTQDHLDYHGSLAAYRKAKQRLFAMLPEHGTAVLNGCDKASLGFAAATEARVLRYGLDDPRFDLYAELARAALDGSELSVHLDGRRCRFRLPLVGRYNIENALAALGAATALGVSLEDALAALEEFSGVPGRLERVSTAGQPAVFVDYAHTDDALDRVLATLRPLTRGALRVVFGCGGDRDRRKRPLMARAVARWADAIVLTSDNPRAEDPQQILDDACVGLNGRPHEAFVDRAEAIDRAIAAAGPEDIVVIAGKGHEDYQIFADRTISFDDRLVAREALARHHGQARAQVA